MDPIVIKVPTAFAMVALVGPSDSYLRILESEFSQLSITVRGNEIYVKGEIEVVQQFESLVEELIAIFRRSIGMIKQDPAEHPAEVLSLNILSNRGKTIRPKTANQKKYVDAIDTNTITFGIGPAGSGKTYLAMAKAIQSLQSKQVNRIILTRPAVEAGERLGFLPGTLHEKIDPYLRPLFDALHDMIDQDAIPRLMNSGVIEVAPLAYMRGRTLNDAFIILDEAQNTTAEQMKMFLTRLGFGSRMVVTGDVTQIDLPNNSQSGLKIVQDILKDVDDIAFMHLNAEDVVRNRLVGDIVTAYGNWDENISKSTFPIRSGKGDR
jgi:phosphate starvation-inducible PhoH-like protein